MPTPFVARRPKGVLRWVLRLPILFYKLGLGWLLGDRFVLLNHVGRKTGQLHKTVVEVIDHDEATGTYFIASGWGYKAQWYQNLLATPRIAIQVGQRKWLAHAETLVPEAGAKVLLTYRHNHPLAARELSRLMGLDISSSPPEQLESIVRQSLPVIALHPTGQEPSASA